MYYLEKTDPVTKIKYLEVFGFGENGYLYKLFESVYPSEYTLSTNPRLDYPNDNKYSLLFIKYL